MSSLIRLVGDLGETLSRFTQRWIPDSWVVCMMLTVLAIVLAIFGAGAGPNEGNRVPFAPRHTLNIAAQYSVPNGYYGRVEYRSVGDTFYDEENNVQLLQEDYSVVNASIGYEGDGYSIRVFGRNLGDEHYYSSISPVSKNFGLIGGMAGSPRLFGVSLSKKF